MKERMAMTKLRQETEEETETNLTERDMMRSGDLEE